MSTFRVVCAENGIPVVGRFASRDEANEWVQKFNAARDRHPDLGLCEAEHTVEEINAD